MINSSLKSTKLIVFIDIDDTICSGGTGEDYSTAKPILDKIEIVNKAYHAGHHIVYYTSRGSTTGKDWADLTEKQLEEWGCKYHELRFDKPFYDILVDDKSLYTVYDLEEALYQLSSEK